MRLESEPPSKKAKLDSCSTEVGGNPQGLGTALECNSFATSVRVYELLISAELQKTAAEIPHGTKGNCYFFWAQGKQLD